MATPNLFPSATLKLDRERIYKVFSGMKHRCRERLWKNGRKAGMVRVPRVDLPFTKEQLFQHALDQVGEGTQCPYCKEIGRATFITLADAVFDHVVPLKHGGSWKLENIRCICVDCNRSKGELSLRSYLLLMVQLRHLPPADHDYIIKCLKTHGHAQTFFKSQGKKGSPAPPRVKQAEVFDDDF